MKCIKIDKGIVRLSNTDAQRIVRKGLGEYCPKSEWKKTRGHVKRTDSMALYGVLRGKGDK